jgi:hypothetical protein
MKIRKAFRAGSFYPADEYSCHRQIEECLGNYQPPVDPKQLVAGIVPHAGWVFSGPTAAKVFKSVQEKAEPETFLIFGAVHVWGVGRKAAIFEEGEWQTPCGTVEIDEELADAIFDVAGGEVIADTSAHDREHSIEVQIPFIQYLFPDAKILPIMIAPEKQAAELGKKIGNLLKEQEKQVVILGSTDLTHYGPSFGFTPYGIGENALEAMKENDQRIIDLVTTMHPHDVINEAERHHNACGAGAIAATIAAAKELGASQGYLLEHTTSQDVMPDRPPRDFVGYAGIIF